MNNRLSELQELDRLHHVHPFTNHEQLHIEGTYVIESGEGCWVTDGSGRKLLDGLAGLWCVNVGYGRAEIADAVREQMVKLPYYCSFLNSTTEPAIRLADKLASLAPPRLGKVFFSSSGSEANETALKLIRAYHKIRGRPQKTKILSRTFSYHGVGIATTSLTGLASCTAPFDLPLAGFVQVPGPHTYEADRSIAAATTPAAYGEWCLAETERTIAHEGATTIAALFAEPIQGAGGVIVPPPGYLRKLRDLCRHNDILFVADEVITAFGRLGAWFASRLWDLDPDFITIAKGVTSGYVPLGATLVADDIISVLNSGGYLAHGFTYSGHPVAAAAALANVAILEREGLIERVRDDVGPYFQQKLQSFAGHRAVGEARGFGLIGALDLVPREGRSARSPSSPLGVLAARYAREEGVIVRGIRDLIALSPPLTISHRELDELFAAVGRALDRLSA
jgi:putrescine aminotransferase